MRTQEQQQPLWKKGLLHLVKSKREFQRRRPIRRSFDLGRRM
jgi:hypothetical protein